MRQLSSDKSALGTAYRSVVHILCPHIHTLGHTTMIIGAVVHNAGQSAPEMTQLLDHPSETSEARRPHDLRSDRARHVSPSSGPSTVVIKIRAR